MKEKRIFGSVQVDGEYVKVVAQDGSDITHMFREDMVQIAANNGQALRYDTDTGRGKRISEDELPEAPKPKSLKRQLKKIQFWH